MERNSGKRGVILYYETTDQLAGLDDKEFGRLIRLASNYSRPEHPDFGKPPELEQEFPGMEGDQARLYRQSWEILAANVRDDDAKLAHKNVKRQYSAFRTNCIKYGHIAEEEVLPYDEWEALGMPGWRQWDKLGRPVPDPEPLRPKDGTTVTVRNGTDSLPFATVPDRYGQNANYNSNSTFNNNGIFSSSGSGTRNTETVPSGGAERFIPPTQEEVIAYFKQEKLVPDPVYFFQYYTGHGWHGISDWRMTVMAWDAKDRITAERRRNPNQYGMRPPDRTPPSEEEIAEYLRELTRED